MRTQTIAKYCFLLYVLFVTACSEAEKPVTKEEAATLAASITKAVAQRKGGKLTELIDIDAFEKRIRQECRNKMNESLLKGAMNGFSTGEFGQQIIKALGKNGSYELVKQYEKDNRQHLVFRMYNETINYHDFELIKKKDQVKIADLFIYITGENLSSTLAQSLLSMSDAPAGALNNIDKKEIEKVQLIKSCLNRQDYERADELYKTLTGVLRAQKLYKIMNIQIASGLGTDAYLAALTKFQQEYPDAPNMYLLMIDAYYLKEDYAGALRCVNSLDSLINKDPFLDYYRAHIYQKMKKNANAQACFEKLHAFMPGFDTGTLELINLYAELKQWDKAVPLTKEFFKSSEANAASLETLYLMYPEFKKKMETAAD